MKLNPINPIEELNYLAEQAKEAEIAGMSLNPADVRVFEARIRSGFSRVKYSLPEDLVNAAIRSALEGNRVQSV